MNQPFILVLLASSLILSEQSANDRHNNISKNVNSESIAEKVEQTNFEGMHEGMNEYIYYKTWNGTNWKAKLENVGVTKTFGLTWNATDPDFIHFGSDKHNDEIINFISDIGEKWMSKCHSHSNATGLVWFTFEHFKNGDENDRYENEFMHIQDWEGKKWRISIPQDYPDANNVVKTMFECHQIP